MFHLICSLIVLVFFSPGFLSLTKITIQIEEQLIPINDATPDENDEHIVTLESRLKSIQQRIESYVLESALLGALAFSGFLQILSQNTISMNDLATFGNHITMLLEMMIKYDIIGFYKVVVLLTNPKDLFSFISALCLLCSTFFLLVIATRLRFSRVSDEVQHFLTLAHDYNEKEDELFNNRKSLDDEDTIRLNHFSEKVRSYLSQTQNAMLELQPIEIYMQLFRGLGVSTFFIIVAASAMFIGGWLAWLFISTFLVSQLYFHHKQLNYWSITLQQVIREIVFRYYKHTLLGGLVSLVVGIILNYGGFELGAELAAGGFGTVMVVRFLYLALTPDKIKLQTSGFKLELEEQIHHTQKNFLRIFLAASEALFYAGLLCKMLYIPGANELLILGAMIMALAGTVDFLRAEGAWYQRFTKAVAFPITITGLLFKILHLPGANNLLILGYILLSLSVLFAHSLFKRFESKHWLITIFFALQPLLLLNKALHYLDLGIVQLFVYSLGTSILCVAILQDKSIVPKYKLLVALTVGFGLIGFALTREYGVLELIGIGILLIGSLLAVYVDFNREKIGFIFNRTLLTRFLLLVIIIPFLAFQGNSQLAYENYKMEHKNTIYKNYEHFYQSRNRIKRVFEMDLNMSTDTILHEYKWLRTESLKLLANKELRHGEVYGTFGEYIRQVLTAAPQDTTRMRKFLPYLKEAIDNEPVYELYELYFEIEMELKEYQNGKKWAESMLKKEKELGSKKIFTTHIAKFDSVIKVQHQNTVQDSVQNVYVGKAKAQE